MFARYIQKIQQPSSGYLTKRKLACLSVHVSYGTLKTSKEDLQEMFSKVGQIWDIVPVEAKVTGRLLKQSVVRFYDGNYELAEDGNPDSVPAYLPPPTAKEINAVREMVVGAIQQLDRADLNGVKIRVRESHEDSPRQLHEWYEDMAVRQERDKQRLPAEMFPINPFHRLPQKNDDYRQGFLAGFKLGLQDGSKQHD